MSAISYRDLMSNMSAELEPQGFVRIGGGVFSGRIGGAVVQPWLGFAGNDLSLTVVLGVTSPVVDKVVFRALNATIPERRIRKVGIPLFRLSPDLIGRDHPKILAGRRASHRYSLEESTELAHWLRTVGMPFMAKHSSLDAALAMALKWNKFDQAQTYYIPALMLMLEMREEKESYEAEVMNMLSEDSAEMASLYRSYSDHIEESVRRYQMTIRKR